MTYLEFESIGSMGERFKFKIEGILEFCLNHPSRARISIRHRDPSQKSKNKLPKIKTFLGTTADKTRKTITGILIIKNMRWQITPEVCLNLENDKLLFGTKYTHLFFSKFH